MRVTYHRVGRISLVPALAAAAGILMLLGVAAVTLAVVGFAAAGVWLLRAIGRVGRVERRTTSWHHATLEGVIVDPPTRR